MPTNNQKSNIFSNLPAKVPNEIFERLVATKAFKLERIVSMGQTTPKGKWLVSKKNEWVVLLKGSATLLFKDGAAAVKMRPGDCVQIPAGCRHRVERTDKKRKTVWLALHY